MILHHTHHLFPVYHQLEEATYKADRKVGQEDFRQLKTEINERSLQTNRLRRGKDIRKQTADK